jgi:Na+-transporting NADH:ubiquinone oxidoreductase subunit NqrF
MGDEKTVDAEVGKNLLDIAHDHDIELEGACGGGELSKYNVFFHLTCSKHFCS